MWSSVAFQYLHNLNIQLILVAFFYYSFSQGVKSYMQTNLIQEKAIMSVNIYLGWKLKEYYGS